MAGNMYRLGARIALGATAGAAVATVGIPAAVGLLGFKAAGIAAGSIAAKMMAGAAVANGGGMAAGSTVAVLQSIGAAGLSPATTAAMTAGGALLGCLERNTTKVLCALWNDKKTP